MRLRVIHQPVGTIDGSALDHFEIGGVYDIETTLACLFLAEDWAVPAADDDHPVERPPPINIHAPVVLIVDDDSAIRRLAELALTAHGYHVLVAGHGEEAVHRVREHCPDLIVLDLNMPVMDGWQFRSTQRGLMNSRLETIPILLLTGADDSLGHAATLGAAGVISKPFEPDALVEAVRDAIPTGERARDAGLSARESAPARERGGWAAPDHIVQLFDTVESRAEAMSAFLSQGLEEGDNLLVCAKDEHWRSTATRLEHRGCAIEPAIAQRRLTLRDPLPTLSAFMRGGLPDAGLFGETVGPLVHRLSTASRGRLRIHSEMVDVLAEQDNFVGAQRLEELWNQLRRRCSFMLFCGYAAAHFAASRVETSLQSVCDAHARVQRSPPDSLAGWLLRGQPPA